MEGHKGVILIIFGLSWLLDDMTLSDLANRMEDEIKMNTTEEGELILFRLFFCIFCYQAFCIEVTGSGEGSFNAENNMSIYGPIHIRHWGTIGERVCRQQVWEPVS